MKQTKKYKDQKAITMLVVMVTVTLMVIIITMLPGKSCTETLKKVKDNEQYMKEEINEAEKKVEKLGTNKKD